MFTVDYDMTNGMATAGNDYQAVSGTLTITGMGENNLVDADKIPLTILEDQLNEGIEDFAVGLMSQDLPDGITIGQKATVKIADNDPIMATMRPSAASVAEAGTVSFAVTLGGGTSTVPVMVSYRTVDGSATAPGDYTALNGTLTFANDSETRTFTLNTRDDDELEPAETLVVRLAGGESAGEIRASASTEVTITDNDSLSVNLAPPPSGVEEGDTASFEVTLSAETSKEVVVSYSTSNGSGAANAAAGLDYTAVDGTLTLGASSGLSQTITVATIDDTLNEAPETFTVTLEQVTMPDGVELGDTDATVEILDNDDLTVMVTADAEIVAEGDPATFTVALSGGTSTGDVVVPYDVGGTATVGEDYTAPDGTLTIDMDEVSGTITIATRTDGQVEADESLTVTLDSATTVGAVTVDTTPATTIVIDPPAVTIDDPRGVVENAGEILFEVNLKRSSTRQITVDYRTEDGTATAPEDYVAQSGRLTFAAGETRRTISIRMLDDALDEADEIFTVILSAPENARLDGDTVSATGTIIDNDNPPALTIADASAKESAGEIAFRVSLDAPSGREVAVSYRTEDGTAKAGEDYGETDGTLTIAAGRTAATILVALKNDILEEAEETFTVRLLDPVNAELADSAATGTILDDDISVAQVWLARFGRTVATHVVDAVGERLNEAAGAKFRGSDRRTSSAAGPDPGRVAGIHADTVPGARGPRAGGGQLVPVGVFRGRG